MNEFEKDVIAGLSQFPKKISSKYFYDKEGDAIFQEITHLPEYYLTNAEKEILQNEDLTDYLRFHFHAELDIYELGAGDGTKTMILLHNLKEHNLRFNYFPIDISESVLEELVANLSPHFSKEVINPIRGTYFKTLDNLRNGNDRPKLVLFLGSNIGNLLHKDAVSFLTKLSNSLNPGDQIMIGFDLVKDPQTILAAYDDKQKVTSRFNKNLLRRINRELAGNFNEDLFKHNAVYNPESGTCASYLISLVEQEVMVAGRSFTFTKWETIHTEISQKYTHEVIKWLAEQSGLEITSCFMDTNEFFADYLFTK